MNILIYKFSYHGLNGQLNTYPGGGDGGQGFGKFKNLKLP